MNLDDTIEFADNPEPRCPCVLLLDTSASMQKDNRINLLNEGLVTFKQSLNKDKLARKRVEIAIVSFNSKVNLIQNFVTLDQFDPPKLTAQGLTHMGSAINEALDILESRKTSYKNNGITYYRPWLFMITDGAPEGESVEVIHKAAMRIKVEENNKKVMFFALGIMEADISRLKQIVVRPPLFLDKPEFNKMFLWLSASLQAVSHSNPSEQVALPPVTFGPPPWQG